MTSWLFTKNDQSIYIVRPPACSLTIYGPGQTRQHLDFADETTLRDYHISLAERLDATGWISYAMNDQRRRGERRSEQRITSVGAERRTTGPAILEFRPAGRPLPEPDR